MVGAKAALEPIAMEEMFFLVSAKVAHLMAEVDLIYRRALNTDAVVDQFNRMKLEFGNFIEERTSKIELGEGTRAAFELAGKDVKLADLRGGAMNNLVGQMLEHLESDCAEAKRISQEFLEAARKYFGSDFPDVKLEWRF